jgi:hypothetical protein
MTIRRAALYVGGASLLAAWLSSAASMSLQGPQRPLPAPSVEEPSGEQIAASVQTQARRLKERLRTPLPQEPIRNPFAFHAVNPPPPPVSERRLQAAAVDAPAALPEPPLALIGVGEASRPEGAVRTAMIATDRDDVMVASVGDIVLQRYRVTAIGADDVELTDAATGVARRLILQH